MSVGDIDPSLDQAPAGFAPLAIGGNFMAHNGPLYVRMVDGRAQLAFRVQARHTNPLNNCHGGMLASFGDMLLPVCIHRQSAEVGWVPAHHQPQIDYLAPAPLGLVQGEADVLRVTRTMVFTGVGASTASRCCASAHVQDRAAVRQAGEGAGD
jgi:uncharacterized protein (TIGR00369 family)